MKKEYQKPMIVIESFQLNAAVAGSCSDEAGEVPINHYQDNCGSGTSSDPDFQFQFFADPMCETDLTIGASDGNDIECYHGPYTANGITFVWS